MRYIVVDLDGTFFNCDHRLRYILNMDTGEKLPSDEANWIAFFENCIEDIPIIPIVQLAAAFFNAGCEVFFLTGRPEMMRWETVESLNRAAPLISRWDLRMRPEGDYRPDFEYKKEAMTEIILQYRGRDPVFVIDDKQSCIDVFKDMGLVTIDSKIFA